MSETASSSGKICRECGKDLAGHRRIKDSLGYICVNCVKAQEKKETEGMVSCAECQRKLKPSGLVPWRNTMICRACLKDHEELNKYKTPPPTGAAHKQHEKRQLYVLLTILCILGVIVVLSRTGVIGGEKYPDISPAEEAALKKAQENRK